MGIKFQERALHSFKKAKEQLDTPTTILQKRGGIKIFSVIVG